MLEQDGLRLNISKTDAPLWPWRTKDTAAIGKIETYPFSSFLGQKSIKRYAGDVWQYSLVGTGKRIMSHEECVISVR
ncbi:hypothetical protein A0J51_03286 [Gluconobacter japonicus]|nr:hypothetical protein A0J51_03286 [Gluconobacter japonicus]